MWVESKSTRFAIVIEDVELAQKFYDRYTNPDSDDSIFEKYKEGRDKDKSKKWTQRSEAGVLNVVGKSSETGLAYYKSSGSKTKLKKQN